MLPGRAGMCLHPRCTAVVGWGGGVALCLLIAAPRDQGSNCPHGWAWVQPVMGALWEHAGTVTPREKGDLEQVWACPWRRGVWGLVENGEEEA